MTYNDDGGDRGGSLVGSSGQRKWEGAEQSSESRRDGGIFAASIGSVSNCEIHARNGVPHAPALAPCGSHALDFGRYYRTVACRPCNATWGFGRTPQKKYLSFFCYGSVFSFFSANNVSFLSKKSSTSSISIFVVSDF
jgi:hypothetical protein